MGAYTSGVDSHVICEEINRALSPFRLTYTCFISTVYEYGSMLVYIKIPEFDSATFTLDLDELIYVNMPDILSLARYVGQQAGLYFRDLPALPINDNIVLSDN